MNIDSSYYQEDKLKQLYFVKVAEKTFSVSLTKTPLYIVSALNISLHFCLLLTIPMLLVDCIGVFWFDTNATIVDMVLKAGILFLKLFPLFFTVVFLFLTARPKFYYLITKYEQPTTFLGIVMCLALLIGGLWFLFM